MDTNGKASAPLTLVFFFAGFDAKKNTPVVRWHASMKDP